MNTKLAPNNANKKNVLEDYRKEKAVIIAENIGVLIQHLNLDSIRQFARFIGAPESSMHRWCRKTGVQGEQTGVLFWLVYEKLGIFGLEVLFTGRVNRRSSFADAIKKMTPEEAIEAQREIADHLQNLLKGNRSNA